MTSQHDNDAFPKRPRLLPPDDLPLSQLLAWSRKQLELEQAAALDVPIPSDSEPESESSDNEPEVVNAVAIDQVSSVASAASSSSESIGSASLSTTCSSNTVPQNNDDDDDDESQEWLPCGSRDFPKVQVSPRIPELDAFLLQQDAKAEALLTLLVFCNDI